MRIRPSIRQFARKGSSHEVDQDSSVGGVLDCAVGCSVLGTSERVVAAANQYRWSALSTYPDTSYRELKDEVCAFWSKQARLCPDNVKVANGSVVVLSRLTKVFVEPGVKVLGYVPQFKEWMEEVTIMGGHYEAVALDPAESFRFDVRRFIKRLSSAYSLVYIDNPNNPSGQLIGLDDIEAVARECAKNDSTLVVDEAFGDYVDESLSAVNLFSQYKNLVVTRALSKGMGIAQFRIGYGILSAELGQFYDRIDLPFPISTIAAFLAGEALRDRGFVQGNRQKVQAEKAKLTAELIRRGYSVAETCDSCPVFVLGDKDKELDLRQALLEKGIRTISGRDFDNLGQNYVRVNSPARAEDFLSRLDS